MDHPAAYARRILINLVLQDAERRSGRRRSWHLSTPASTLLTKARRVHFGTSMTSRSAAGRWRD
jgi:hypothetical protein